MLAARRRAAWSHRCMGALAMGHRRSFHAAMGLLGAALGAACSGDAREAAPDVAIPAERSAAPARAARVSEEAEAAIERDGSAAVVVALDEPGGDPGARRAAIAARQEGALRGV